ncbi:MAG: hypothetical protein KY462_00075 [Actinobacteria bacterium]|nr:hypothetical protein [Actinomycetota bacterium]
MEHVVRYRTPAGEDRLEDVPSVEAALERVEHLRNDEGVADVRVYRQVPVTFRAYYRAAVVTHETPVPAPVVPVVDQPSPPAGAMPLAPAPVSVAHEENVEGTDTPADNRKISLFNRG